MKFLINYFNEIFNYCLNIVSYCIQKTALIIAVEKENINIVSLLLNHKDIDVNAKLIANQFFVLMSFSITIFFIKF